MRRLDGIGIAVDDASNDHRRSHQIDLMAVNNASAETLAEDAPSQGVTEEGAAVAVGPILERLAWETSEGRSGWNAQRKVEAPRRGMVPYASHNRKLAS